MSFQSTPLGQGRRLDHYTFLNKPNPNARAPHSEPASRSIPTSYSYGGAPSSGTRSPPKPNSKSSDKPRSSGPRVITSPPDPQGWNVKDTSVNIATAFTRAASGEEMPLHDPNQSWASSSRAKPTVPRSTSVEYEKETQSTSQRRLAPPPSRSAGLHRRPVQQTASTRTVPDSEGEEDRSTTVNGRAKSPFDHALGIASSVVQPLTMYMRQRSREPEQPPRSVAGRQPDASYDYAEEEREYQASRSSKNVAAHKKNRMSMDNKAYKPTDSDLDDESDGDLSEGTRKRRKKKKGGPVGGPLTSLPVAGYDKRKRRKSRGSKGGLGDDMEGDEGESGSEDHIEDEHSYESLRATSQQRGPPSRAKTPLGQPAPSVTSFLQSVDADTAGVGDDSLDVEQGLESIQEEPEQPEQRPPHIPVVQNLPKRKFSLGAFLGRLVNLLFRISFGLFAMVLRSFATAAGHAGYVLGSLFDITVKQPMQYVTGPRSQVPQQVARLVMFTTIAYALYWLMADRVYFQGPRTFQPPSAPAADIAELAARLQRLEVALHGVSQDGVRDRGLIDREARGREELASKVNTLEVRVQRAGEAEERARNWERDGLRDVKQELQSLQSQIVSVSQAAATAPATANDDEARAKLKAFEDRLGSVEGDVKDALEMGKNAVKVDPAHEKQRTVEKWWQKLAAPAVSGGKSALTIKSSDGQDVTALLGTLVEGAVGRYSRDMLARPDVALYSAGATIVPHLTSDTYEIRPHGLVGSAIGMVTGHGYAMGRPPVTALHPDTHVGMCWPFSGTEGQLGVKLRAPTKVSEITIDHVAHEVAFDMRTAPRDMELWGMIEGRENEEKVEAYLAERSARTDQEGVPDEPYPRTLPGSPRFVRLAKFTYDIHAADNIQSFPVDEEIGKMDIDVGIVALRILNNWGQGEFTCLYRVRVHGNLLHESPPPLSPEEL